MAVAAEAGTIGLAEGRVPSCRQKCSEGSSAAVVAASQIVTVGRLAQPATGVVFVWVSSLSLLLLLLLLLLSSVVEATSASCCASQAFGPGWARWAF